MKSRSITLKIIHEQSLGTVFENLSIEESFQNQTLRPILKFQNELLIQVFINYAINHKGVFFELSNEKKLEYIKKSVLFDLKFRNTLIGIIVGHFTIDEYSEYSKNTTNINKRLINMLIERIKNQMMLIKVSV